MKDERYEEIQQTKEHIKKINANAVIQKLEANEEEMNKMRQEVNEMKNQVAMYRQEIEQLKQELIIMKVQSMGSGPTS